MTENRMRRLMKIKARKHVGRRERLEAIQANEWLDAHPKKIVLSTEEIGRFQNARENPVVRHIPVWHSRALRRTADLRAAASALLVTLP